MLIFFIFFQIVELKQNDCESYHQFRIYPNETIESASNNDKIIKEFGIQNSKIFVKQNISLSSLNLFDQELISILFYNHQIFFKVVLLTKDQQSTYSVIEFSKQENFLTNNAIKLSTNITKINSINLQLTQQCELNFVDDQLKILQCRQGLYERIIIVEEQNQQKSLFIQLNSLQQQIKLIYYNQTLHFIIRNSDILKIFLIKLNQLSQDLQYTNFNEIEYTFNIPSELIAESQIKSQKILDFKIESEKILLQLSSFQITFSYPDFEMISKILFDLAFKEYSFDKKSNIGNAYEVWESRQDWSPFCLSKINVDEYIFLMMISYNYLIFEKNSYIICGNQYQVQAQSNFSLVDDFQVEKIQFANYFIINNRSNYLLVEISSDQEYQQISQNQNTQGNKFSVVFNNHCFSFYFLNQSQAVNQKIKLISAHILQIFTNDNNSTKIKQKLTFQLDKFSIGFPLILKQIYFDNEPLGLLKLSQFANFQIIENHQIISARFTKIIQYFVFQDSKNQLIINYCDKPVKKIIKFDQKILKHQIYCYLNYIFLIQENSLITLIIGQINIEQRQFSFEQKIIFMNCQSLNCFVQLEDFEIIQISVSGMFQDKQTIILNQQSYKIQSICRQAGKIYIIVNYKLYIYSSSILLVVFDQFQYHQIICMSKTQQLCLVYDTSKQEYLLAVYQFERNFLLQKLLPLYNCFIDTSFVIQTNELEVAVNMKDKNGNYFIFIYDIQKSAETCLIQIIQVKKPVKVLFTDYNQISYQEKNNIITLDIAQDSYYISRLVDGSKIFTYVNLTFEFLQFTNTSFNNFRINYPTFLYDVSSSILYLEQKTLKYKLSSSTSGQISLSNNLQGKVLNVSLSNQTCCKIRYPIQIIQTLTLQHNNSQSNWDIMAICQEFIISRRLDNLKEFQIYDYKTNKNQDFILETECNQFLCNYFNGKFYLSCQNTFIQISEIYLFNFSSNQFIIIPLLKKNNNVLNNKPLKLNQEYMLRNGIYEFNHNQYNVLYWLSPFNELIELFQYNFKSTNILLFSLKQFNDNFILLELNSMEKILTHFWFDKIQKQFHKRQLLIVFPQIFEEFNCLINIYQINGEVNSKRQYKLNALFACDEFMIKGHIIIENNFQEYQVVISNYLRYLEVDIKFRQQVLFVNNKFIILLGQLNLYLFWTQNMEQKIQDYFLYKNYYHFQFHQIEEDLFFLVDQRNVFPRQILVAQLTDLEIQLKEQFLECQTNLTIHGNYQNFSIPVFLQYQKQETILNPFFPLWILIFITLIFILYMAKRYRLRQQVLIN